VNTPDWKTDQPIYRQILDIIVDRILAGTYLEGELLPSVRQLADEFGVSMITAAKVSQNLDSESLAIKKRGVGSIVRDGVTAEIKKRERERFFREEWPAFKRRIELLDIDPDEVIHKLRAGQR